MTVFWIAAASLLALVLAWLLPALWRGRAGPSTGAGSANLAVYRDQLAEAERDRDAGLITPDRFEQLRGEIQRRVLEDTARQAETPPTQGAPARRTAIALLVLLPLASVAVYLALGRPDATDRSALAAQAEQAEHAVTPAQIEGMVAALAERLKQQPNDVEGWQMLGRSYSVLGRGADAVAALRKAVALQPRNPDLLADLADMIGMAQGRKLAGEPAQLVQQVLALDPRHPKALALAGTVAFEARDYAGARRYWEQLVAVLPPDSELARSAQGGIEEARQLESGGATAAAAPSTASAPGGDAAPGQTVEGEVVLAPALAAQVRPGDTVFVFARAAQGPRMPLAIVKQPAGTWPLRFTLDDRSAMTPQARLSQATQVVVVARVSRSGNATPQSGDLFGESAPVTPGTQGLKLVIDRVQP